MRETEKLVASTLKPFDLKSLKQKGVNNIRDVARLEEELSDALGLSVQIKLGARGKGQLTIHFSNNDALEGVLVRLRESREGQQAA